jgi:hypothetical protein
MTFSRFIQRARKAVLVIPILGLIALPFVDALPASAAPITGRAITLSNSAGAATGVTYTLTTAALPTSTPVRSVKVQFCTALPGCSAPSGFSSAGSGTLPSQPTGLGAASAWSASTASANELRITHASNVTAPSGAVSITWNGVVNPTANDTTFYGIITTYSDAAYTTPIDTGSVALSTASQIQVALSVYETLTFCAGTSITGQNCGTISGSTVNLGTGSTTATQSGTSVLAASTNAGSGYSITVNGATLTSGANTITALSSGGTSSVGTKQFGLNLVSNTTPSVGSAVSGTGTASAAANYNTSNTFRFATGEIIASVAGPSNANAFTISYIANIDGLTPPGSYTSNLTYIATANF